MSFLNTEELKGRSQRSTTSVAFAHQYIAANKEALILVLLCDKLFEKFV